MPNTFIDYSQAIQRKITVFLGHTVLNKKVNFVFQLLETDIYIYNVDFILEP